jgi:hypothetical protein
MQFTGSPRSLTDTITPYTPNYPSQHNYAAVKFLYNRLHTYNIQPDEYLTFCTTIPFRCNHINHTTPNHKNSDRLHTHQHKNGPRLLAVEKKPHILPTYSDAPTSKFHSAQITLFTTGQHINTTKQINTHSPGFTNLHAPTARRHTWAKPAEAF